MTFEELVTQVAKKHGMVHAGKGGAPSHGQTKYKVAEIILDALNMAADAAKSGAAPKFPGIGRFVVKAIRSTGRNPDGSTWTRPGRTKLTLRASYKRGGRHTPTKQAPAPAATVAA